MSISDALRAPLQLRPAFKERVWGGHLLAPDGAWLAMKGKPDDVELAGVPAGFRVAAVHALAVPGLDAQRQLVVLRRAGAGAAC